MSPARLIEPRGFERTHRDATAEDYDCIYFLNRIFNYKPAANVQQQRYDYGYREEYDDRENPGRTRSRSARRFRFIEERRREWVVRKHGRAGW